MVVLQLPPWLCQSLNSIQQKPTEKPQPTGTPQPTGEPPSSAPHTVLVYRGLGGTNRGEFRIDPPARKDWLGGLSVYEILYGTYKYQLPFAVTYNGSKVADVTTGVVVGALTDGSTYIGGGTALYTPEEGDATRGSEHWSIIFGGMSVDDLKSNLSQFAKKFFNIKSQPQVGGV